MPKAIIIGASSGIGAELARRLADSYELGIAARRTEQLEEIGREIGGAHVAKIDIADERCRERFESLIHTLGGVDLVIIAAGVSRYNPDLIWARERETIQINAQGFAAIATAAIEQFDEQKRGQLVGISSVAAEIGNPSMPAYSASKAFVSLYLEALRYRNQNDNIIITDIRPGYVDTPMAPDHDRFWECSTEVAAKQIQKDIRKQRQVSYVSRRWRLLSILLQILPDRIRQNLT